jgi:hypothetical protein
MAVEAVGLVLNLPIITAVLAKRQMSQAYQSPTQKAAMEHFAEAMRLQTPEMAVMEHHTTALVVGMADRVLLSFGIRVLQLAGRRW